MKPPSQASRGQLRLPLYQEAPLELDPATREGLLNVLADLLREALGAEANAKEGNEERDDESENHS